MKFLFVRVLFLWTLPLYSLAAPLGTIPQVDTDYLRILFDLQSDVWATPNSYKQSPVRIFSSQLLIPLAQGETWRLSGNFEDESLSLSQTEIALKNNYLFVGNNLQDRQLGLGFSKTIHDGSAFNFIGHYASASDEPYTDIRNRYFEGSFFYLSRDFNGYRWLLALDQSDNRGIANGRPFPYLGVQIQKSENVQLWVGFPFLRALWLNPGVYKYEAQLTPFGAFIDSERPLQKGFNWHARTAFTLRSYLYENRTDNESRLFYQQWTAEGGLRKNITPQTLVELSFGYAFDRKLFESDSVYTPRADKTDLESDLFARFRIGFTIL